MLTEIMWNNILIGGDDGGLKFNPYLYRATRSINESRRKNGGSTEPPFFFYFLAKF